MFDFADIKFAVQVLSPAVTMAVTAFLAIIIIYKNHHKEANRVFFFWMAVSAANAFLFLMSILLDNENFYWASIIIGTLDACIAIHFILLFSIAKKWISGRWSVILVYIPAKLILLASLLYIFLGYDPIIIISSYTFLMYLIEFFAIILLVITYLKTEDKTARMQLVFISIGIFLMTGGTFIGIGIAALISEFLGNILLFIIIPVASILLAITVLRFRLMGVEEVIKKGLVFSILSFFIVCLFILLGEGLEFLFEDIRILGLKIPGILTAVIIALLIIPLQGRLEKLVNKIFPKKEDPHIRQIRLDTYRTALAEALEDGKTTKRERKLLERVRESLDITPEEDAAIREDLSSGPK